MMYHEPQTKERGVCAAALCAIVLLVAGAASGAETAARVTAVVGAANVGDVALDRSVPVGEDASIQTADDGNCAMLVDEDALVELCASTIMTLTRSSDTGQRVVKIDGGNARIVVEPRVAGERIEIHTPAAIATILGTTVFVEVDPATGDTKFTADHPVRIESSDPRIAGSAVSSDMKQVTVRQGEGPSDPREIPRTVLSNLGGCLVDFHQVALLQDRNAASARAQERMALGDGKEMGLTVGEEGPVAWWSAPNPGGEDWGNPDPFDKNPDDIPKSPELPEEEIPGEEVCEFLGDNCIIVPPNYQLPALEQLRQRL